MVLQTPEGTFTASNITRNLAQPGTAAGIKHYSLTMTPAYNAIPEFLSKTRYANPSESAPFNLAYNTDMPVFEWRKHNPKNASAGQRFMAAQRMGQRSIWDGQTAMDDFKLSDEDLQNDRVMMCDVGGGQGHQCMELRKHQPDLRGRIVTEDLPMIQDMISNREELESSGITLQNHNFMQEQPVRGAKVYYLRNVIHNCEF
jgi:demethylsterigmatocystin 6-O-methyltransferase